MDSPERMPDEIARAREVLRRVVASEPVFQQIATVTSYGHHTSPHVEFNYGNFPPAEDLVWKAGIYRESVFLNPQSTTVVVETTEALGSHTAIVGADSSVEYLGDSRAEVFLHDPLELVKRAELVFERQLQSQNELAAARQSVQLGDSAIASAMTDIQASTPEPKSPVQE